MTVHRPDEHHTPRLMAYQPEYHRMIRRPTILIADDHPENLVALRWTLRDVDAELVEVSDGNQALAASLDHDFALAILDVHMPIMDGFEVAELLRSEPRTRSLPIIFLTAALTDQRNIFRGYEAGGVDYIIKPYDPEILLGKVGVFLKLEHQREELQHHREHLEELVAERTSEIRTLNRSLQQSQDRLQAALEQSTAIVSCISDAVLVIDNEGTVLFANPASEQLLGSSLADIVGKPFGFPAKPNSSTEITLEGDSEPKYAEMRVVDFEWQGKPAVLASLRDITDNKRAIDLQARLLHADRLSSIGQLASGVAHEINNPAHFIMANLEVMTEELNVFDQAVTALRKGAPQNDTLLSEFDIDDWLAELGDLVSDNLQGVQRIVKIVKDLRSFSRVEHDEIERVDLNDVVDVACNMTFNEIRHRARLLKDKGQLPRVAADRGKLTQVLINLVLNASHAIEEGAAEHNFVRVQTRRDGEQIKLTVEDTGHGIPEQILARIFDPFFTTKSRDLGSGLGLSLSAEIIRRHGGEIRVESQVGIGSHFHITLPVVTPLTASPPEPFLKHAPCRSVTRARVLIIDDEPQLLEALRRVLNRAHEVVLAAGGAEGLRILNEDQQFDVILCDLMMPQIDGLMVHAALREQWPQLLERIVFCSGGAFTERAKRFISEVDNICLDKPVTVRRLRSVIEQVASREHCESIVSASMPTRSG